MSARYDTPLSPLTSNALYLVDSRYWAPTMYHSQDPKESHRYLLSQHGPSFELAPHFKLVEFASHDGADVILVHDMLVALLERIREEFQKPVWVTSGYRTPDWNHAIGGITTSIHCLGMAADILIKGVEPFYVQNFADTLGVGGLGRYSTFTHVDVYGKGRRWSL